MWCGGAEMEFNVPVRLRLRPPRTYRDPVS
jgi:hypothetical protein